MPTYTWTDNKDGTGATLTTSGLVADLTFEIWVQPFGRRIGAAGAWSLNRTGVGNGTFALSLPVGYYFAYAFPSKADMSPVAYFAVTDGEDSVHFRAMQAVEAKIKLLDLDGLTTVITRKLPTDRGIGDTGADIPLPAVVISTMGIEAQPQNQGTNQRDDVDYPVNVTILAADNGDLVTNQARYLKWREQINRAFRNQRLDGVPEIMICRVQPAQITAAQQFWANVYHSSLIVRCVSREVRGM